MNPLPKDIEIKEQIGRGSFSRIYKAVKHAADETDDTVVALKIIKKKKVSKILPQIRLEISILKELDHPNIISCIETYEDEKYLYIMMEYCKEGDLCQLLKTQFLNETDVRRYFLDLVAALKYLHERKILHRDLKPKNILVTSDDRLKLIDFGFAKHASTTDLSETICGSPLYMAPELLSSCPYNSTTDLWSIGIILYEMIAGHPPYHAEDIVGLRKAIQQQSQFDLIDVLDVSPMCKEFLFQLLDINGSSRISWQEFFEHPWILNEVKPPKIEEPPKEVRQFTLSDYTDVNFLSSSVKEGKIEEKQEMTFEEILNADDDYVVIPHRPEPQYPFVRRLRTLSNSIIDYFLTTAD